MALVPGVWELFLMDHPTLNLSQFIGYLGKTNYYEALVLKWEKLVIDQAADVEKNGLENLD